MDKNEIKNEKELEANPKKENEEKNDDEKSLNEFSEEILNEDSEDDDDDDDLIDNDDLSENLSSQHFNDDNDKNMNDVELLSSEDESDGDEHDVNDLLNILMTINKFKHKKKDKTKKKFLPLIKKYLKADFEKKEILYNRNEKEIINRLSFLAKNILSKKIPIEITASEKYMLLKLTRRKYKPSQLKVLLLENFVLHSTLERAVILLEKTIRKNEQTSID